MTQTLKNTRFNSLSVDIDWYDSKETVKVTDQHHVRFELQKDYAIDILRIESDKVGRFNAQMVLLLSQTRDFVSEQAANLTDSVLTMRDGQFLLLFIANSPRCDDDFEDAVSDFDFDVANDPQLDLVSLNVMTLPLATEEALSSFIDKKFCINIRKAE